MADAIQPATRNLYQKKFAFLEYRDGAGHSYAEQIRLQSWPNNEDVPRRSRCPLPLQRAARGHLRRS